MTLAVFSFLASSSISLSTDSARDSVLLTLPMPLHFGQFLYADSPNDGLNLCLDISNNPNLDMFPIDILALSCLTASLRVLSTCLLFLYCLISIKSITNKPPKSLSLHCLAISSAASTFVFKAVDSISDCFVDFPELISIETNASV